MIRYLVLLAIVTMCAVALRAADQNQRIVIYDGVATEVSLAPEASSDLWLTTSDLTSSSRRASFTGLYVLLAASTMVFAALTSALVVRRGLSDDWASMAKPRILWVNTVVLLASSLALEIARRMLKAGQRSRFNTCCRYSGSVA